MQIYHGSQPFTLPTSGVSCLNHELLDHSVEDVAIVVAITGMDTEVLHRLRTTAARDGVDLQLSL